MNRHNPALQPTAKPLYGLFAALDLRPGDAAVSEHRIALKALRSCMEGPLQHQGRDRK